MNDFTMGLSLLADAADKAVANTPEVADIGFRLLMLIVLCLLPFVVGAFLARALRLKEFSNRIGTVLFAVTVGLAPFGYHIIQAGDIGAWKDALRWGIDLAGGTNLIYQIETTKAAEEGKDIPKAVDQMVSTVAKRINPSGSLRAAAIGPR